MANVEFSHPFVPYEIQLQLMEAIHNTIENGNKVGLFESPTGTGKTLSIICSSMTWLRNFKKNHTEETETIVKSPNSKEKDSSEALDSDSDSDPEWVNQTYKETILSRSKQKWKDYELHLDVMSQDYEQKRNRILELPAKKKKISNKNDLGNEFIPDDYYSDDDGSNYNQAIKMEISQLMKKIGGKESQFDGILENDNPRILYSSRTHSQLNQFAGQLTMTHFDSSLDGIEERIKYLPMGSRKQLCIHPKISQLQNPESVNEACRELNKEGAKCEYLQNSKHTDLLSQFNDYSLTKIHDIEELYNLGEELNICPYYSIRSNTQRTEIVSLPYQMLLEKSTRGILNLNIKNCIVIIDEAHNLLDVINGMNSVELSNKELNIIIKSLKIYLGKFNKRLNVGNRINLTKLIKICQLLSSFIDSEAKTDNIKSGVDININDVFIGNTGDLFNIHKIDSYLSKSKIAFKIESYFDSTEGHFKSSSSPLLFKLNKFFKCVSNPSNEGKFFWDNSDKSNPSIKYMMLDPSEIFRPLIEECRCVLLCGGTMEPMSDFKNYLFPYIPDSDITTFSCNHIIAENNLKVIPISTFNSTPLNFLFKNRMNDSMIINLGLCLIKLVSSIPNGIVIFFPSYKYLELVVTKWKEQNIYQKIEALKDQIFTEIKSSNTTDELLTNYCDKVFQKDGNGAVLFSVVGGKLSEGINFSDELARAVIMIGLPYPNVMSGELIARKEFVETSTLSKTGSRQLASQASKEFIENICMKAVNQSVGRSIRHVNDYSMIFLIDLRFEQINIQNKLSRWIRQRITKALNFTQVMDETNEFFLNRSITKLV